MNPFCDKPLTTDETHGALIFVSSFGSLTVHGVWHLVVLLVLFALLVGRRGTRRDDGRAAVGILGDH